MVYDGTSKKCRVRLTNSEWPLWKQYIGQECDAIVYDDGHAQINSEQLNPPIPKWQSTRNYEVIS